MMTSEIPASYSRYTAAQAAAMREMTIDAIQAMGEDHPDEPAMRQHLANLNAVLAARHGQTTAAPADPDVTVGRKAGSAAANQFGTFTVHAASEKQVGFLQRLIDTKDHGDVKIPSSLDGISKKAASALIDKLIDRPAKSVATAATTTHKGARPASEKQVAFLTRLYSERSWVGVINDGNAEIEIDTDKPVPALTGPVASKVIDVLMAAPRKQAAVKAAELAPGAYRLADGRIVRVYLGQQSGKMLAAELVDITAESRDDAWNYLGMASRFVTAQDHRLTVEECEALAMGSETHGWCCVCGRRLDVPTSVARSIGPVCRAKQGGI